MLSVFLLSIWFVDLLSWDVSQNFVMNPKKDLYGLGFDPFKDAPEFRGIDHHGHDLTFLVSLGSEI